MNRLIAMLVLLPLVMAADWPQWRGPTQDGVCTETGFPTEWDATKNIKWKVKLTGNGNASPVIHGNDLLIASTTGRDHSELVITNYDRLTGKQRWSRGLTATPAETPFSMFPPERGHAASTPVVTDRVIVNLFGTGDLVCLDRQGRLVWQRALALDYGIAASPIIANEYAIVQIDHLQGSYLLAVDLNTGKTVWKTDRKNIYDNWASPVIATIHGEQQVICLGTKMVIGYSLKTGTQRWVVDGLERLCSCTPILRGDQLYVTSGPNGANMAIDLAEKPSPKIVWQSKKTGPFVPSAIVVGDLYFVASDQGAGTCLDLKTGAERWKERIGNGRMRPSPVAAGGNIYFTALDGVTTVISASGEFKVVSKNAIGEDVAASLALCQGNIFIRSDKHLWCVGK